MKNVLLILCATLVSMNAFGAAATVDPTKGNVDVTSPTESTNPHAATAAACNCDKPAEPDLNQTGDQIKNNDQIHPTQTAQQDVKAPKAKAGDIK